MNPGWWQETTVYQIYPRSFFDANGDGIGDLAGIRQKLAYLKDLGVETLWLSPFFRSPHRDFGYDISDYRDVHPEYGSLDEFRLLIAEIHNLGMKIVLDMVLNHTSSEHPWFLESRASLRSPRRDFYLWRKGRGLRGQRPPNNWQAMIGGSGWHRDPPTGQWYWASFLPCQPDLNYRNPEVRRAMLDMVRFWLEEGVDGLRLDIYHALFKDPSFADNPFSLRAFPSGTNPAGFFQEPRHTLHHPDVLDFGRELRALCDGFSPERFLVGEAFGTPAFLRRYCGPQGLHLIFLFSTLQTAFSARAFRRLIEEFEASFAPPLRPTYVFGNHDQPRYITRLGERSDKAKLLATMQLTLRGVPFLYYGEEIGMPQHTIPLHQAQDPLAAMFHFMPQPLVDRLPRYGILLNRDECRQPMQWDESDNAGFSPPGVQTWLPVHDSKHKINVAAQERDQGSLLSCYKRILRLRRSQPALSGGSLRLLPEQARALLSYRREAPGAETLDVHLNFSSHPMRLPRPGGRILFSCREPSLESMPIEGDLSLAGYEGVVVSHAR